MTRDLLELLEPCAIGAVVLSAVWVVVVCLIAWQRGGRR